MHNLLDTRASNVLGLGVGYSSHLLMKTRVTLLCLPGRRSIVTEQDFDLLERLATCFRVREPELNGSTKTKNTEDDE
jgi:hypothetical protein